MSLVMVVDDDSGARRAMEEILTDEGYEVVAAQDGKDAMVHLEHRVPSVLVTDLEMPEIDGERLIAHTRSVHPALPILVITSRLVIDAQRETERLGVRGFLNKPIDIDALIDGVGAVLAPN